MMVCMRRVVLVLALVGCGDDPAPDPMTNPDNGPPAGNPDGMCAVPAEAMPEDVSAPSSSRVVGTGSPSSCTSKAVVDAVALGGYITFNCGPDPVVIEMDETAKIFNDT